ncbi:MAG: hypothetical protein WD740_06620 [Anaerolineales bacterium]
MDQKIVASISKQIARQFPEVAGALPSIKSQAGAKGNGDSATYLLTFKSRVDQPSGFAINRAVRVVANDAGRILKITTSR